MPLTIDTPAEYLAYWCADRDSLILSDAERFEGPMLAENQQAAARAKELVKDPRLEALLRAAEDVCGWTWEEVPLNQEASVDGLREALSAFDD